MPFIYSYFTRIMQSRVLLALTLAIPLGSQAVEMNWSGFGTIGYAISDEPYHYQRFIDNHGTFKREDRKSVV